MLLEKGSEPTSSKLTANTPDLYPSIPPLYPVALSGFPKKEVYTGLPKKISHLFDESVYGLITRIGTETGSLVEGTGLGPATPSK